MAPADQAREVWADLDKLMEILEATKGQGSVWQFIDARPYPSARELTERVLARFASDWPDPRIKLALVGANPAAFPRSCVTCGSTPWEPLVEGGHRDIVRDDADLLQNHRKCDLRPCGLNPHDEPVVVLEAAEPGSVSRLRRLDPKVWPDHGKWADLLDHGPSR